MPNVRNTPPRRRAKCPACGRDMSYTHPWVPSHAPEGQDPLKRDYQTAVFTNHNRPEGGRCQVNGPHGFGVEVTW